RRPMIMPVVKLALQWRLGSPADFPKATLEGTTVIAAVRRGVEVKLHYLGQRVRHLGFGYEIAPPELDAVDAEVASGHVEQALTKKVGLKAARSAIGADRRLVGEIKRHAHVDIGRAVWPGQDLRSVAGAGRPVGAQVGAHIRLGMAAQRQDRALAAAGDFEGAGNVAGMIRRDEVLAPVLDPLHRTADNSRRERYQKILRIEFTAHAETAADIGFD